jgi:carboxymethylenebutenolidase
MQKQTHMKQYILLFIAPFLSLAASAQSMSCCSTTSTERFAMLGTDKSFAAGHADPLPFHLATGNGKMITFPTTDGKAANAYEVRSGKESNRVIFMFQEWWGLNDYIKQEAEKLATELGNVTVYAIDLYDGRVATTSEEAGKYMSETKEERIRTIIRGALTHVGTKAKVYTIGWCFGGGWSLQATLMADTQAAGCVMYYGMPESDLGKLKTLHADVLGIFANQDKHITPAIVTEFESNMKKLGKKLSVKRYDAVHAFANPSNPNYNKEYSDDAHQLVLAFFKEHLK